MNPNTATATELRDWLAIDDGWVRDPQVQTGFEHQWYWTRNANGKSERVGWTHPYPHTIDAAAAAMPMGWDLTLRHREDFGKFWAVVDADGRNEQRVYCTADEVTERFRLAVLARLASRGGAA